MVSNASNRFKHKLQDVQALLDIHTDSSGRGRGRRESKLRVLHKAGIALLVAAWETYIESLLEEGILRISDSALSGNDSNIKYKTLQELIKENVQQATNRLNTANSNNVLILFRNCFGIGDIRRSWGRPGMDWEKAYTALDQLLRERHAIVHGASSDPEYQKRDVILWQQFLQITVDRTDLAARKHIAALTGKNPW